MICTKSGLLKKLPLAAGPVAFMLVSSIGLEGQPFSVLSFMAATTLWIAIWWMLEPVHLAVTSLLPLVLLPVLGIADMKIVATQYMDQVMFLFIGGFLLAFALEKHGLHQRIALFVICRIGATPQRIIMGVMLTAWLVSMWISNTATVMMLLPSVMAIIGQMDVHFRSERQQQRFAAAVLLALAYAATIGGMATLVGTPPNMVFYRFYMEHYADDASMNFTTWFVIAAPVSLAFLLCSYIILSQLFLRREQFPALEVGHFHRKKADLGAWSPAELRVLAVFLGTVILWFTRAYWVDLFPQPGWIQDSTIAMAGAILLFFIPSGKSNEPLLIWEDARRLPLHVIFLFGSGFALAYGFEQSGLSALLAGKLSFFKSLPLWQLQLMIILMVLLISEFASNVASIQLVLPILLTLQQTTGHEPQALLIPATMAASMGFMLPVATAPNTIVFGAGRMRTAQMMRAGVLLDLSGAALILLCCLLVW
ncbi:MAG: Sodium-dependent dicarboxylate transporter SdcS [Bacteroidota bacterium]|jgi:sodium-dependent dicarboxylate transporter 2/3/5